jgi:hypothetical protein
MVVGTSGIAVTDQLMATTPVEDHSDPPADAVLAQAHREALMRHADDDEADAGPGVGPVVDEPQLRRIGAHEHGGERSAQAAASGVQFNRRRGGRPRPPAASCWPRSRTSSRRCPHRRRRPGRRSGGARSRRRRGRSARLTAVSVSQRFPAFSERLAEARSVRETSDWVLPPATSRVARLR